MNFTNFLNKIDNKKSVYIFLAACAINFLASFGIYYFYQFQSLKKEATGISEFVIKTFNDKNIEIKIKKDDIELNAENYLIENKDFPIALNSKNLIYISKNANYADFGDKEVLAIINSKELIAKLDGDFQSIPLVNFLGERDEALVNKDTVKGYIDSLDIQGSGFLYSLFGAFSLERIIFYVSEFVWAYFILTLLVFYLLKFSGYVIEKEEVRVLSNLLYSVFLVFEVIVTNFRIPLNFIHVFVLGFFGIGLYLKFSLDKKLKS